MQQKDTTSPKTGCFPARYIYRKACKTVPGAQLFEVLICGRSDPGPNPELSAAQGIYNTEV
jgi:hypothetical protein